MKATAITTVKIKTFLEAPLSFPGPNRFWPKADPKPSPRGWSKIKTIKTVAIAICATSKWGFIASRMDKRFIIGKRNVEHET